jgi:hypothetical protein
MLRTIDTVFTGGIITLGFGPRVGCLIVVGIVLFRVLDINRILVHDHFVIPNVNAMAMPPEEKR